MAIVDAAIAVGTFVGADALGATGAAMVGGSLLGAGAGALYSGITGDGNVLNSALNGALIGGGSMGLGSALGLTGASGTLFGPAQGGLLAPAASAVAPVSGVGAPVATGGIGSVAPVAAEYAPAAGYVPTGGSASLQAMADAQAAEDMAAGASAGPVPTGTGAGLNTYAPTAAQMAANPGFWDSSAGTYAKYGLGALALGSMMNKDNKKYGTFTQDQVTQKPLQYPSNFGTYQPLDTSVMRQMGQPTGYQGTPYGAPGYIGSRVGYAEGGTIGGDGLNAANPVENPSIGHVEQMSRDNAVGQNQMFPQAMINSPSFASATNTPMGTNMVAPAGDTNVDPYTGAERFAEGGVAHYDGGGLLENIATMPIRQLQAAANNPEQALIGANTPFETSMWNGLLGTNYTPTTNMWGTPTDAAVAGNVSFHRPQYAAGGGISSHLGGYSDGGRMLKGPGDGMSDNIPATIGGKQPARLADGEFVVPADVVSHLGNGSTDAGAKQLYKMMDKVRQARTGTKKQGKEIKPGKFLPK